VLGRLKYNNNYQIILNALSSIRRYVAFPARLFR
jgi:hypothetical protein